MPKHGLGRGFDSLIPSDLLDESFDITASQDKMVSDLRHIKLSEIEADSDQPRRRFEETALHELADSIKEHGVLQPIVVTPRGDKYVIVAGERRFRASKLAGLDKIPALVRALDDQHRLEISLIENLQRRDLSAIETATAYLKLRDQFNLTLDQMAKRLGHSNSAISNTMRLLKLPDSAKQAMADGKISEGQARPLIGLDEDIIKNILPVIIKQGWSARRVEQYVVALKHEGETISEKPSDTSKHGSTVYHREAEDWSKRLAAKVSISTSAKGRGSLTIKFQDQKDFDRIKRLLNLS